MDKIRILLADDHALVRKGIMAMLESESDLEVIGEANDGKEALELSKKLNPDLLIIDIRMPEMNGIEATSKLHEYSPQTKALILSMHDSDDYVLQSLQVGASGYLLKDTEKPEFLKAIHQVMTGNKYFSGAVSNALASQLLESRPISKTHEEHDDYGLTKRELEILGLIINGKKNQQIAETLGKSVRTIETHRFNIMKKMGVNNAIDMVNKAMKENLV